MWPFKRRPAEDENDLTLVPVSLDKAHTYVAPGSDYANYPHGWQYGEQQYASRVGVDLQTIPNQDRILVHWYRPPAYQNPAAWWDDNNADDIARGRVEHLTTTLGRLKQDRPSEEQSPYQARIPLPRVTSDMSPSNYRFERPYDQNSARLLNGVHASMASMRRNYPVSGVTPVMDWRNTFRIEPVARDAENVDLSATSLPTAVPATYVTPSSAPSSRWGL